MEQRHEGRQVQRFCRVCESNTTLPGFEIRHVNRKHQLTASEHEKISQYISFISHCGNESSARARKVLRRDSFAQFMGKATRDSLLLDSVAIETERAKDRRLGIVGLYLVDGATIRLCPESGYRNNKDMFAVQVVNGLVRTAYGYDDLIYEARNPRSDVTAIGYGLPETELLVRVVTSFLNAMTLNSNVFDKNSIPKGILHLSGNYSQEDLSAFKRYWQGMVKGLDSHLTVPVLVSKDQESRAAFEKFGIDFNEMMFAKWMTFLTSLICAIYGMSPSEINFDSFTGGSTSALGGNDTAEKLAASKDSGLRPLLSYFEGVLTDYVVSDLDEHFCFRWTGLDVEDQNQKYELRKTLLTLNELRAEEGYENLDGALGDAPVNASLLNAWMQLQAAEQPSEAGVQDEEKDSDTLSKANSHHDGLGRFAENNDTHPYLPKSDAIKTLQEAKAYFSNHIAGHWRITINRKSGCFSAIINFNENQNHAYTKADKTTGKRNFDQQRARLMQHLIDTISKPDIILENGNRDLYIEKQNTCSYYAVVLEWRNDAKEYRFRSAHCWDKKEYDRNVQTYRRPKARGFKLEKNKAPEQLKKSFGASTAFTRLRDMIEELQPSPDCRSVVGQLNESGWELAKASSCSPTVSIDGFTDFVKAIDWQTIAIEPLHKANSHHDDHGRFADSDGASVYLAPNGKPSNLNAVQYAQVRTPEFKQWFGDWMYNPDMEMTPIKLIDDPDMPVTADAKTLGKYLLDKYRGLVIINAQTHHEISIYRVGLLSSLKNRKTLARRLYAILPELLEKSAYVGYEENTKREAKPNILGYETYYALVSIDWENHAVRLVVDRVRDDARGRGYYYHQVEEIALEDAVGSTRRLLNEKHEASLPESPSGKVSLGQLTKKINVDYSKSIDKNGEPLASEIERYLTGADKPVTDDPLHKAHTHDTPHDIFKPHENPFIRGLVEDYYDNGMIRFSGVRVALNQWLAGQRYQPKNAGMILPSLGLSFAQQWSTHETKAVVDYLSGIEPKAFSINEYALLAKLLVNQYLPNNVLIDEAITHAAQSYLMGAAQSAWQANHSDDTITEAQVAALRSALPTALEDIVNAMRWSGVAKATLDYGTARAAENIVALTDEARARIQNVLMEHELKRLSGDSSATAKKLEQTLFDNFAAMNRDWRRIALTETGELSLQGFVAAQPIGAKLKRIEHYDGACHACKKIDGTVMEVVDPDAPDKNGTTQVWVGKTNSGRSSSPRKRTEDGLVNREEHELWWLAAGVMHPHCRGLWVRVA